MVNRQLYYETDMYAHQFFEWSIFHLKITKIEKYRVPQLLCDYILFLAYSASTSLSKIGQIGMNIILCMYDLVCQRWKKRRLWFLVGTNSHKICRPTNLKAIFKQPINYFVVPSRCKETRAKNCRRISNQCLQVLV